MQPLLPEGSEGLAATAGPDRAESKSVEVPLTVENVGAVEAIFDVSVGANVENEHFFRFLRVATTAN